MAHLRSFNTNTIASSVNSSVSTLSCSSATNNGDGGDGHGSATHNSSQSSGEIDKLLSQLKCKRAFQDDESLNGQAASVFSTQEVSQLMALICGVQKNELKPDIRHNLKHSEAFFKELIKDTKVSSGNGVTEGFNELFHNPEHIVFQTFLTNEPAEWAKLILPMLLDIQRKEVLKEEILRDIQDFQLKRRELSKDIGLEKKRLKELQAARKEKEDRMQPDNIRRLTIAVDSDKSEADKIEEQLSKHGTIITNDEVDDLVSRFGELKSRRQNLRDELQRISADGILPSQISEANIILENRKCYLDSLLYQIANPSEASLDNSVFQHRNSSSN